MFSKIFCGSKKTFSFFAVLFLNLFLVSPAFAQNYVPLVNIPGVNPNSGVLTYLSGLYNFLISIVGILAMAVIIYGGLRYLTSAGNPSSVEEAKDAINSAIVGLLLALASWVILSTINPDILVLKPVGVGVLGGSYSYQTQKTSCAGGINAGTKDDPCSCIDGATGIYATGSGLTPTTLTLTASPNPATTTPPGNKVTISGKLTDTSGNGVSGTIKINMINTTLNASSTFPPITTAADGSYSYTGFTPTCAATNQMQAVFAGDATHTKSASAPVTFVINGLTICTKLNYAFNPAKDSIISQGSSNPCDQICSDESIASDGKYHCLVHKVKLGSVPNGTTLTSDDYKRLALYDGTQQNPYELTNGMCLLINKSDYSIVLNQPAAYAFDGDYNSSVKATQCTDTDTKCCESGLTPASAPPTVGEANCTANYATLSAALPPDCSLSITPKAVTCKQTFCIKDSVCLGNSAECDKGHSKTTSIYFRSLAPN